MAYEDELYLTIGDINVTQTQEAQGNEKPEEQKEEKTEEQIPPSQEQEKPETQETPEDKKEGTPASENNDSSSTISVLANYLKEEGVFSSDLEGIENVKNVADLKELIAKQVAASRHSDLSEHQQRYLESIESGIPLNQYEQMEKQIAYLENISQEEMDNDEELRFQIIAQDLIESGMQEDKAVAFANRSIESGKDKEDANEAIKSLYARSIEKFKEVATDKREQKQATLAEVKTLIDSKQTVMGDISLSKEDKEKIFKTMTTQVDTTENGAPLNQFEKWRHENGLEAELILNALFVHTNGFKNLGSIKTEVASNSAKQLEELLRSTEGEELKAQLGIGSQTSAKNGLKLM